MSIPNIFKGFTPNITNGGLTPLQLVMASYLTNGNPPPLFINQEFLEIMKLYSSSAALDPLNIDLQTGIAKQPSIVPGISGIGYITLGDDLYVLRQAEDCGPDETPRYEKVYIGKRSEIAAGTFAYYGGPILNGSVSQGSGSWNWVFDSSINAATLTFTPFESYRADQGETA